MLVSQRPTVKIQIQIQIQIDDEGQQSPRTGEAGRNFIYEIQHGLKEI